MTIKRSRLDDTGRTFRLRLVHSVKDYVNGTKGAADAFGWVGAHQREQAQALGLRDSWARFTPTARPLNNPNPDHDPTTLARAAFRTAVLLTHPVKGATAHGTEMVRGYLAEQVEALEIIKQWHVVRGALLQVEVPRLTSPDQCMAYAVGLILSNTDDLGRAVKACRLVISPDAPESSFDHWPHYFVNLPVTKRVVCCTKHGDTFRGRKRPERQRKGNRRNPK